MITVVGIGEDGLEGLSARAKEVVNAAKTIYGGARHLAMVPDVEIQKKREWSKNLRDDVVAISDAMAPVAVLATGDPLHHGIGSLIIDVHGIENVTVLPAPGAFSLAAARMGWSLDDPMVKCISVHARPFEEFNRYTSVGQRLLVLSKDGNTPQRIAKQLCDLGFADSEITVMERMGGEQETRTTARAAETNWTVFDNLNVVAVDFRDGGRSYSTAPGLPDDAFDHDGTITKREVRAATISALGPRPGDVLWDVGAGHGTVAIEFMRTEPAARALAFEVDGTRADRIRTNANVLGVPELQVVEGNATETLRLEHSAPTVIFLGGGITSLLDLCIDCLPSAGRLVANAVTIGAQERLMSAYRKLGGDLVRVGVAPVSEIGPHAVLKPAIDVLQWRWAKP